MSNDEKLAMAKDFFQMLQKLEEAKQKHAQQYPGFPPSIEGRELRPTPWRQSDELQEARSIVPEPSQTNYTIVVYPKPVPMPSGFFYGEPVPMFRDDDRGQFKKILVRESGVTYEAWSADGKTPIFPIPL